jgi:hypothetical protein
MDKKDNAALFNQAKTTNKLLFFVFFVLIFFTTIFIVAFTNLNNEFILAAFPLGFFGSVFISDKILARSYSKEIMDALPPVTEMSGNSNQANQFGVNNGFDSAFDPVNNKTVTEINTNDILEERKYSLTYDHLPYNIHHKDNTSM